MKSCIRRSAGSLRIYRARNKRTGDAVVRYYVLERVNGSQKWIHITEWNLRSNREAGCSVIFQTIKHRYRAPCCFFLLSLFRLVIADIQYVRLFSRSIDLGPRFWSPSRKSSRLERHRAILRTCAFSSLVFFLLLLLLFFFFRCSPDTLLYSIPWKFLIERSPCFPEKRDRPKIIDLSAKVARNRDTRSNRKE